MSLRGAKNVLLRVPPLYRIARRCLSFCRAIVGPPWLRHRVRRTARAGSPLRIVIGSSQQFEAGWLPTNVEYLDLLKPRDWQRALGEHRADALLAEHVWEHLTLEDGRRAAAQCLAYLKPGGYLRIAVPDGNHPDPEYIAYVSPGGFGSGADDHRMLYTAESLEAMLTSVGFSVRLLEYHDAAGRFHQQPWRLEDGPIARRSGASAPDAERPANYTSLIADAMRPR